MFSLESKAWTRVNEATPLRCTWCTVFELVEYFTVAGGYLKAERSHAASDNPRFTGNTTIPSRLCRLVIDIVYGEVCTRSTEQRTASNPIWAWLLRARAYRLAYAYRYRPDTVKIAFSNPGYSFSTLRPRWKIVYPRFFFFSFATSKKCVSTSGFLG